MSAAGSLAGATVGLDATTQRTCEADLSKPFSHVSPHNIVECEAEKCCTHSLALPERVRRIAIHTCIMNARRVAWRVRVRNEDYAKLTPGERVMLVGVDVVVVDGRRERIMAHRFRRARPRPPARHARCKCFQFCFFVFVLFAPASSRMRRSGAECVWVCLCLRFHFIYCDDISSGAPYRERQLMCGHSD